LAHKGDARFRAALTPVHLDFIVTDLDEMVARLCGLGASLDREVQSREYGRMANMSDPFGNGFDLIEFSGPGYDNVRR
jgi:predicted enzyme related to lactoylglutathione lyase